MTSTGPTPEVQLGVFILLPVLNEAQNITELLDRIDAALTGTAYTICIVDDGSKDGTVECIERKIVTSGAPIHIIRRSKTVRGSQRGSALHAALLWGLNYTKHEIFVEMDGDLSHRPEELREGIQLLAEESCDIAIASKYLPGSKVTNRPWGRLLVSRVCSFAVGCLLTPRIRDYSNGYRFYTRMAAQEIAKHHIRYASPIYLSEVLALWLKEGLSVAEFQTTYIGRNEGVSKLRFIDLFKAALAIFEVAIRYHLTGFERISEVYSGDAVSAIKDCGQAQM